MILSELYTAISFYFDVYSKMSYDKTPCTRLPDGTLLYTTLSYKQPTSDAVDAVNASGCPPCKPSQLGVPMPYQLLQSSQEPQTQVELRQPNLSTQQSVNLGLIPSWTPTFKAVPYRHAATVTGSSGFPVLLSDALQCPNVSLY